ncbi:membrane-anchored junction protein isoform 6-T15 [Geothlypis trichas]
MGPSETPPKPPKIPHASPPRLPLVAGWAPVYSLPGLQLPKTVGPRRTPIEPGLRFRRALRPVRGPWGPGLSPKHCPGCSPSASLNRKEVKKGSDELFRKRNEMSESTAMKEAVKRRRVEIEDDTSCPQSCMDRTGADCVHHMSKSKQGFEKNSSKANELEFSPASLTKDCDQLSFWGPVEFALEQKRTVSQAEGAVQLLQQVDQTGKKGNMKSEGRGLSQFWRSIIFSPLQHLFGGKN